MDVNVEVGVERTLGVTMPGGRPNTVEEDFFGIVVDAAGACGQKVFWIGVCAVGVAGLG